MGDERPSDALQPAAKKRSGGGRPDRNDIDDDAPSADPGTWAADATATRERRKVHVRRGVGGGGVAAGSEAQPAAANPFAGIAFSFGAPAASGAAAAPVNGNGAASGGEATPPAVTAAPAAEKAEPSNAQAKAEGEDKEKPEGGPESGQEETAPEASKEAAEGAEAVPAPGKETESNASAPASAQESKPAATTAPSGSATPGSIFGGSAGATSGFASLAAGSTAGGSFSFGGFGGGGGAAGSSGGGLFGTGASSGIFGSSTSTTGGIFSSAGTTVAFGGFSFPKLDAGSSLGKPLFGATSGAEGAEGGDAAEERPEAFEPSEDPSIKPVIQLAVVQKVTGEEDEQTIYAESGKLYEYDSVASKWRERGSGELRVNVSAGGAASRMLMRQAGNLRLLLNARITANMAVQRMQGACGVTFGCVNTAALDPSQPQQAAPATSSDTDKGEDKDGGLKSAVSGAGLIRTWAFRTKGEDKILALLAALEKAKLEHSASNPQDDKKPDVEEAAAA